ncbi:MAG: PIN domain-containing protein [Vicinamibacteria bacterium]
MKVFLDANVLFTAAHRPSGKAAFVISQGKEGFWEVVTSRLAVDEALRNLEAKLPGTADSLERLLKTVSRVPTITGPKCPLALPEKDAPIFLSAWRERATHLLTGDLRDFGRFMNRPEETCGVVIQTVAAFLDSLQRARSPT